MNDTVESAVAAGSASACNCTCERDRHLFCGGPKRILALDGGGVRGAISVAFLEEIEKVLARRLKREVLLGHWFDLVGGTSTGAIIAGALAMGFAAEDVTRFYKELAPKVFVHPLWRIMGLLAKFDAELLREEIQRVVGKDCTLGSHELITGFSLVAKRMDTGSTWLLANNSRNKYWEGHDGVIGNKDYLLASLIRASTAAPLYFDPEEVVIAEDPNGIKKRGMFVDGGVTPHNNPSLAFLLLAVLKAYQLRWETGPDKLTLVSIGTGTHRARVDPDGIGMGKTARLAVRAMKSIMNDVHELAITQMQYLGETLTPWYINGDIDDMPNETPPHGKLFRFIRYDVRLELDWLYATDDRRHKIKEAFKRELTETDMIRLRSLDDTSIIPDLYKLGQLAAEEQVKAEHWLGDVPQWCGGVRPSAPRKHLPPSPPDRSNTLRYRALRRITEALSHARARLAHAASRRHAED